MAVHFRPKKIGVPDFGFSGHLPFINFSLRVFSVFILLMRCLISVDYSRPFL